MNVLRLSDTEVIMEFEEGTDAESVQTNLRPLKYWLDQEVQLKCRVDSYDEVERAKNLKGMEDPEPPPEDQELKFLKMMEDIHRLAANPHGKTLWIPTFNGAALPGKKEATYAQ